LPPFSSVVPNGDAKAQWHFARIEQQPSRAASLQLRTFLKRRIQLRQLGGVMVVVTQHHGLRINNWLKCSEIVWQLPNRVLCRWRLRAMFVLHYVLYVCSGWPMRFAEFFHGRKSIRIDFLDSILNVLSRCVDGIINLVASGFTTGFEIFSCLVYFFAGSFQRPLFFTGQEEYRNQYQH
jgi:hypothetical protein